jgi:fructoselysine-6-P-deglycase FrlB-like protein
MKGGNREMAERVARESLGDSDDKERVWWAGCGSSRGAQSGGGAS